MELWNCLAGGDGATARFCLCITQIRPVYSTGPHQEGGPAHRSQADKRDKRKLTLAMAATNNTRGQAAASQPPVATISPAVCFLLEAWREAIQANQLPIPMKCVVLGDMQQSLSKNVQSQKMPKGCKKCKNAKECKLHVNSCSHGSFFLPEFGNFRALRQIFSLCK